MAAAVAARGNMANLGVAGGVVHALPADLKKVLVAEPAMLAAWQDITPLARNEWICWIESVKKAETRQKHIERARENLIAGKRRPCCWPGCPHRQRRSQAPAGGRPTPHAGLLPR